LENPSPHPVPAVLWAGEHRKKAVISTCTINLQEQLVGKDLPVLQKILPQEFEVMLWKGRANYLCPMRLQRAIAQADGLFTSPERAELERLRLWSESTTDGACPTSPLYLTAACGRRCVRRPTFAPSEAAEPTRAVSTSRPVSGC
jgi:Rad3-related DNA helicase